MMQDKIVYLMYHELELPNRNLCNQEMGYKRYALQQSHFYRQISTLYERGFIGLNVSQAVNYSNHTNKSVVITFDDGCETDLIAAAPILKEFNFNATFYVVGEFIGRPGYLSKMQLCELSDLGFEIGSHSMTHRYLSDLSKEDLFFEISGSKDYLEQIIGKSIKHFSCPGGRWSRLAAQISEEAGFFSMATSKIGANNENSDKYSLSRICIMRNTPLAEFNNICSHKSISSRHARDTLFSLTKSFLGNKLYERVRSKLLSNPFIKNNL